MNETRVVKWDRLRDNLACAGCGELFRQHDIVLLPREAGAVHYRMGCIDRITWEWWGGHSTVSKSGKGSGL